MAVTNFTQYLAYFRDLADSHVELAGSFIYGNAARLIEAERAIVTYPVLWLEAPEVSFNEELSAENWRMAFAGALHIMANAPQDDYAGQETAMQSTLQIALDIIAKMAQDCDNNEFDMLTVPSCQPLEMFFADNLFGWRIEVQIIINWGDCVNAARWT